MTSLVTGCRIGAFIILRDEDGLRHAVKLGAVLAASDADPDRLATVLQLAGNRTVLIQSCLDEVLAWLA